MQLFNPDELSPVLRADRVAHHVEVLRPVQYLGNKQRSLGTITRVVQDLAPPGGVVADLFTGTSVVAQALASGGSRTLAVDVSPACAAMANATLGVCRSPQQVDVDALVDELEKTAQPLEGMLREAFVDYLSSEHEAIRERNGARLLALGSRVPQVWRDAPIPPRLVSLIENWQRAAQEHSEPAALLSPVVAGTYFGVAQAIELDARRRAVSVLVREGRIDAWGEAAIITALLAAASAAAFSPGKHFAQPHKIEASKDLSFHCQRVLTDRSVDVPAVAAEWIRRLVDHGRSGDEGHVVMETSVETLGVDDLRRHRVSAVYADPPYTAQQYSRFYHLLDTLAVGKARPLQTVRGRVTGGLYPAGRFLSAFCSKRQARSAFSQLANLCCSARIPLVLSYSSSAKGSTGNARMINLTSLLGLLTSSFGRNRVEVIEFDHQYRQFNSRAVARSSRRDPEVLVIAHAP